MSAFVLKPDGTYDSEGYFGFGLWQYKAPYLFLVPDRRFAGTLNSLTVQNSRLAKTHLQMPIAFTYFRGALRFYEEDLDHSGDRWIDFASTTKALKYSSHDRLKRP